MGMKTAMQELMYDLMNDLVNAKSLCEIKNLNKSINKCKALIEKEKQQIIEAFEKGKATMFPFTENGDKYYKKQYGN